VFLYDDILNSRSIKLSTPTFYCPSWTPSTMPHSLPSPISIPPSLPLVRPTSVGPDFHPQSLLQPFPPCPTVIYRSLAHYHTPVQPKLPPCSPAQLRLSSRPARSPRYLCPAQPPTHPHVTQINPHPRSPLPPKSKHLRALIIIPCKHAQNMVFLNHAQFFP